MAYAPLLQERWRVFIIKYREKLQLAPVDPVPALSSQEGDQISIMTHAHVPGLKSSRVTIEANQTGNKVIRPSGLIQSRVLGR